jgi:hypothetical protein
LITILKCEKLCNGYIFCGSLYCEHTNLWNNSWKMEKTLMEKNENKIGNIKLLEEDDRVWI